MGIFGFLKKAKEPPKEDVQPGPVPVKAEGALEWLRKEYTGELDSARSEAGRKKNSVEEAFGMIQHTADELDKASSEGNRKVLAASGMVKDNFVKTLKGSSLPGLAGTGFSAFSEFCTEADSVMNNMLALSPKQNFFLSKFFGKETFQVIGAVKQAKERLSEFRRFLEEDGAVLKAEEKIEHFEREMKKMEKTLKENRTERTELERRIESCRRELEKSRATLDSFLDSEEWGALQKGMENIERLKKEAEDTGLSLKAELESVKRPLKKLAHVMGEACIEPFTAAMDGNTRNLADALRKILETGELKLKQRETEKVKKLMKRLESGIPEDIRNYKKLLEEKSAAERAVNSSGADARKAELEENVEKNKNELEHLKKTLGENTAAGEKIKGNITGLKKSTEKAITEALGRQIKLVSG